MDPITAPTSTRSLWLRLALPFLAFVVVGSIALVMWLHRSAQAESQRLFYATARNNADFLRSSRVPATQRTAESFSRVLGCEVLFHGKDGWVPAERSSRLGEPGVEVATATVDAETDLYLVRPVEPATRFLLQPQTVAVLLIFWTLSLGLGWMLARDIVLPLQRLAARLPHIADHSADAPLPEATRSDEIGQLARAYAETRAALAVERSAREQAERLATLGRMTTGLAHEINNPLAAIKLHAQLLDTTPAADLPAAARAALPTMIGEAAKIESLVNQWMFLARPNPPQTSGCDLSTLVAASLRVHEPAALHAGVRMENQTSPGLRVTADARRLGQAIGNLILNAIQAMAAQGGTLTVTGSTNPQTTSLSFHDTGPGFSPTALARHAELFYSEKEGGMGIGLNVTFEILRAHGGELKVENAPAGGAVATLVLPTAGEVQ